MRRLYVGLFAALVFQACSTGPRPRDFEFARMPAGVYVAAELNGHPSFLGELLEVNDTVLIVRGHEVPSIRRDLELAPYLDWADATLRELPYGVIERLHVRERRRLRGMDLAAWSGARRNLRLLARFPQGMSEGVLSRLLELHGQAELETVDPTTR